MEMSVAGKPFQNIKRRFDFGFLPFTGFFKKMITRVCSHGLNARDFTAFDPAVLVKVGYLRKSSTT
jgi:hypothetical protein